MRPCTARRVTGRRRQWLCSAVFVPSVTAIYMSHVTVRPWEVHRIPAFALGLVCECESHGKRCRLAPKFERVGPHSTPSIISPVPGMSLLLQATIIASLAAYLTHPPTLQMPPPPAETRAVPPAYVTVMRKTYGFRKVIGCGRPESTTALVGTTRADPTPQLSKFDSRKLTHHPVQAYSTALQPPPLPCPLWCTPTSVEPALPATAAPMLLAPPQNTVAPAPTDELPQELLLTLPFALRSKRGKRICRRPVIATKRNRAAPVALQNLLLPTA